MPTQEAIKIYSESAAKALKAALIKLNPKKKVQGDGEFEVVATTEGVDRDGEVIQVKGWDFENFNKNPILLWGHDYKSLPIGAVTELRVEDGKVIAKGVFARSSFAQEIRALYDDGFIKTVSVGFIPHERNGDTITKAELLELSFVSVPANPDALDRLKSFESKYLNLTVKGTDEEVSVEAETKSVEEVKEENKTEEEVPVAQIPELMIAEYPRSDETAKAYGEEKAGRVLSAKNRTLVQDAVSALQALLDASETPEKDLQEEAHMLKKDMQTVARVTSDVLSRFKQFERQI